MKIILLLVLSISLYLPSNTQDDCPSEIICIITGRIWLSTFKFNVSTLPEDCGIFTVGNYAFDRDDGTNSHFMESDKGVVKSLTKLNKIVYTRIGFQYTDNWPSIFEADESSTNYQSETIDPLVTFLNAFNISGIFINMDTIYDGYADYPKKISTFVTKVKQSVKRDLKFGLEVDSSTYKNFSISEYFDFSITNKVLDIYIIDFSLLNECDSDGHKYGLAPIECKNPNMTTMDQVTAAVTNSSMDQSKIYCLVATSAILPEGQILNKKRITTVSTLCNGTSDSSLNTSTWCSNPSELSYQQGGYAKKHYKGIVILQLDTDDYDDTCGCGLFPVTNIFINGWKSSSFSPCAKIDQITQS
ncbi:uncharacterized protein LOC132917367 [Rhopalosiphum padi]|uniref:uncharacterized protein LOC132917367 n=1 Tax=Rhopalosiphum padi TaxID=40932 RepID=UPI00298D8AF6|nr:uncharacterized protein LOC132917367 [Rhopalosiphum padi]